MLINNIYNIKTALFDIDGLLVDSERIFNECWVKASESVGYPITPEMALELRSLDSELAGDLFLTWFDDKNAYPSVRARRRELMAEKIDNVDLQAKEGIEDIVGFFLENSIKMAVVTSASVNRATEYLKSAGIDGYFTTIISTDSVQRGKPFPDVYEYAIKNLHAIPNETLALEDSPNGVKSAHSAKCITAMIPDLSDYNIELEEFVDFHFKSLKEMVKVLRKQSL